MYEYVIAFVIILCTMLYFAFFKRDKKNVVAPSKTNKSTLKKEDKNKATDIIQHQSEKLIEIDKSKIVDNKEYLINSFKEGKDISHPFISSNGKTILFHDEKKVFLCFLTNFNEKNPRFMAKSVEQDVICDASFSENKNLIAVGLKNTKDIVFFEVQSENGKQKLNKLNKKIHTTRKFEIKNVSITKDGNYVSTTGTGQDTQVQIYETRSEKNIDNIDTNEIQNVEMKLTPDDRFLTISTYMYEIAVIEFKKSFKFNKSIDGDETILKIQRNKSVSGIKIPIDSYDFSNDNRFFIVCCENKKIKIFQNFGNIEESKIFYEFNAKEINSLSNDKVSLYVTSYNIGKITGYVAISNENNILVYNTEGILLKIFQNAHESKINGLKLVQNGENIENCVLISASRDGRFYIWNINH